MLDIKDNNTMLGKDGLTITSANHIKKYREAHGTPLGRVR